MRTEELKVFGSSFSRHYKGSPFSFIHQDIRRRVLLFLSSLLFLDICLAFVMGDCIFSDIERMQMDSGRPWGRFLDAGTGVHSLKWVAGLETGAWTALTAALPMAESLYREPRITEGLRDQDDIVIGNWDDEDLLYGQQFDTVLADYLVGAMDGFSPYKQDRIFERLRRHVAPGGRLYLVGLEPIPEKADGAGDLVCQVVRLRDACIKLAGHRCYREYPLEWTERHLRRSGYRVLEAKKLPILYSFENIKRQIDVASSKLPYFEDTTLREAMRGHIRQLTDKVQKAVDSTPGKRIRLGFDYIVCAEPVDYTLIPPVPLSSSSPPAGSDQMSGKIKEAENGVNGQGDGGSI